ncbi:ABC transporter ATP-binding protein [Tenacibaculum sp. C7A-26P2]|uniref:ABC transporter ATP-binding protein n=1 Tax=Tenacibaculum sp. C7A-26P2 TaxID=3447504 RepID=UPI003F85C254
METILSIKNLTKNYGKIKAVKDLSFEIKKGNIYGILGPNGSGKSTTLGIILNVVNKTSGAFNWFNGNTTTHEALKKVGAIIERPNFYPFMTAFQNLELICKIKGVSNNKINEKLKEVNLFERKDDKFKTYSLGMKQRLAIASALLNDPEILILDEPTNGLDPQGIHEIRQIIKKIAKTGTTILLASHLLDEVEKICTHVIVLRKGEKLYSGRVETMIASNGIVEIKTEHSIEKTVNVLKNYHETASVNIDNELIIVQLENDISAATLNKYLFENNVIVSHLVKRKPSLEEQFLDLTNNN